MVCSLSFTRGKMIDLHENSMLKTVSLTLPTSLLPPAVLSLHVCINVAEEHGISVVQFWRWVYQAFL